ncbi:MAG: ComF family protein [Candidatus Symbiothrix sp.]|jgi:ComF family protein|nr:ComF family protein [Candidatus Symbiothrix sp.]
MNLKKLWRDFIALFYPDLCVGCASALVGDEQFFCSECLPKLPVTSFHRQADNLAYERLAGKIPVIRAAAYFHYNKTGLGQKTVADVKYHGNIALGRWAGNRLAQEWLSSGFFADIDYLIPVPLHPKKRHQRGFNQSEVIAQGISTVTQIPVDTVNLYRSQANETQTRKGLYERWKNTQNIFCIRNNTQFVGKHVMLIDDVLTTGSTLEACAKALLETPDIRISVLTLAVT